MAAALRIAFLTNLIPPYHKPLLLLLTQSYAGFRVLLSTPMETNRPWLPEWKGLDVVIQRGLTLNRKRAHPRGFSETSAVHFPVDTLWQLSAFQPDAVISVEMGFRTLLAWLYVTTHRRSRLVIWTEVTPETERDCGRLRAILRRFLAKRADGFLAVGGGGARYASQLGAATAKVFQLAYSTEIGLFSGIPLERHGPAATRLLFSGQLIERKGLKRFLEVLAEWALKHPERQVEFRLVGEGPLRSELTDAALPGNVKLMFIGTLQYNQLPDAYAAAGIFVLPTLADTWAVVVNEAMASGVPVLGSVYSQAVAEMVEDGRSGWTFRPDVSDEMAQALERALSTSDECLNEMRRNARERALKTAPQDTAAVCERAIREVLQKI